MRKRVSSCLIISLIGGTTAGFAQNAIKASGDPGPHPMIDELKTKGLLIPVVGVTGDKLKDSFFQPRSEKRVHYAIDIPAPKGTAVLSTDWGRVLKLFTSKAGGLTVYAIDPTEKYIYYYAHLQRYRPGLAEGMVLARGDTIGFVGTSGNAPENAPHLHFTILRALDNRQWSKGTPINPAKVF
jgi:murein DD-endopeptidase MepM/ murein hydrolase activator NlpD